MISRTKWLWRQLTAQLWVRVASYAVIAVFVALLATFAPFDVPAALADSITATVVNGILTLIASSMLSVTTFSLGVMVSAFGSTSSAGTPRATQLVMADPTTQNVLSIFLGAFIYSLVGVIALSLGAYGPTGRVILFFVTIAVAILIVAALIRWIQHLSRMGRLATTIEFVEQAADEAMRARVAHPHLGGNLWDRSAPPNGARAIMARRVGYVQMVDVEKLSAHAQAAQAQIYVNAIPGDFVHPGRPLAYAIGERHDEESEWANDFVVAEARTFTQDPRFGMIVLAEIGSKALSPAVNDIGSAVSILTRAVAVLSIWRERDPGQPPTPQFPRLHIPALSVDDLFADAFRPIARDGAGLVEIQLRLQACLLALHQLGGPHMKAAALRQSREALERARALPIEADRQAVEAAAAWSA